MPATQVAAAQVPFNYRESQPAAPEFNTSRSSPPLRSSSYLPIDPLLSKRADVSDDWQHRFQQRPISPDTITTSLRSSDLRHDHSSAFSFSQRSISTSLTSTADSDRLPPISSLDFPLRDRDSAGPSRFDSRGRRLSIQSQMSQDRRSNLSDQPPTRPTPSADWVNYNASSSSGRSSADHLGPSSRPSPRHPRRLASPTQASPSSVDWESGSDRGSPHQASSRAMLIPSNSHARRSGNDYPPPSPRTQVSRPRGQSPIEPGHVASHSSSVQPGHDSFYREERFRDQFSYVADRQQQQRDQPWPASPLRSLKRKASLSEAPPRRAPFVESDRSSEWHEDQIHRDFHYDRAYPRSVDRADSAERMAAGGSYPSYGHYSPPPSSLRYPRDNDPRYSPRRARMPSPPPLPHDGYRAGGGRPSAYNYDSPAQAHASYSSRPPDRFTPNDSPSLPPSRAPPPLLPPSTDVFSRSFPPSHSRHDSPSSFHIQGRPHLPPLSSRPGALPLSVVANDRRARVSPLLDPNLKHSPSPDVAAAYPEPFYPDRRYYYPRDRIQDPEMDEYYNDAPSRPRYSAEHSYPGYSSSAAAPPHEAYGPPPLLSHPPSNGGYLPPPKGSGQGSIPLGVPPLHNATHPSHRNGAEGRDSFPPHPHHGQDYGPPPPMLSNDARDMPRSRSRPPGGGVAPLHVPPGPSAGIAPPPRRRGKLPKPVTDLLKSWLLDHASHPYPTEDEKRSLCNMTGLTLSQVSNWFINARRRILLPSGNGQPSGPATAAQVKAAFSQDTPSPPPDRL